MKCVLLLTIVFSFGVQAQDSYLFKRKENESASAFVDRHLNEYKDALQQTHPVIEGYWGDISKGKKIMAFYSGAFQYFYEGTLVVFQPVGDGTNYVFSKYDELGGIGRYYDGVISVFYSDLDDNGIKELVIIEKGGVRVPIIIESIDEDGEIVEHETTACCEDVYSVTALSQFQGDEGAFLPFYTVYDLEIDLHEEETVNAEIVKKKIQELKDQ